MEFVLSRVAKDEKRVEKYLGEEHKVPRWRTELRSVAHATKVLLCIYCEVCALRLAAIWLEISAFMIFKNLKSFYLQLGITVAQCVLNV